MNFSGFSGVLAGVALVALTGCDRDEIKVYRVAKETAPRSRGR
ncbi:MAG: hypothetical protein NTZ16_11465 [Verrucomicrobia bacterium]|nr:hypothetical protein [Verrucomicrobiota bacterium]